ncbi:hypothetical protein [Spirosoma flavum]|uniref:RES family NAD+ phosphorylase n=1 Tax=Spirosoma flavum TaxID=2048557 RepID=A0ABW6AGA4_9BACT
MAIPSLAELVSIAEHWQKEMKFWLLRVPSVHSSIEKKYLFNPLHPEHATLNLISMEPHPFDPRLT